MAELVQKWIASNGKMFDEERDALYEEKVIELADFIDENACEYGEISPEAAARALLKSYKVEKL